MKALVFSDSHYERDYPEKAFDFEKPDYVIFLGDGESDFEYFTTHVSKGTPATCVRGNCDLGSDAPLNVVDTIGGVRFYITHGAKERVKQGLDVLFQQALMNDCEYALYGHTHYQCMNNMAGVTMINPGSIAEGFYATIEFEGGCATPKLKNIQEVLWKDGTK